MFGLDEEEEKLFLAHQERFERCLNPECRVVSLKARARDFKGEEDILSRLREIAKKLPGHSDDSAWEEIWRRDLCFLCAWKKVVGYELVKLLKYYWGKEEVPDCFAESNGSSLNCVGEACRFRRLCFIYLSMVEALGLKVDELIGELERC